MSAILHNLLLDFGPAPAHLHVRGCLILSSDMIDHNKLAETVVVKLVLIVN